LCPNLFLTTSTVAKHTCIESMEQNSVGKPPSLVLPMVPMAYPWIYMLKSIYIFNHCYYQIGKSIGDSDVYFYKKYFHNCFKQCKSCFAVNSCCMQHLLLLLPLQMFDNQICDYISRYKKNYIRSARLSLQNISTTYDHYPLWSL